jgi:SagB-type dehydrogenase family enzyme
MLTHSIMTRHVSEEPEATSAILLPEPHLDSGTSVESALRRRRSLRDFAGTPLDLAELSQLLWAAQGITGPEGKRAAPSAGALYPLQVFVVAGVVIGLSAGVYRYRPHEHDLLPVAHGDRRAGLAAAALEQDWLAKAPLVLVLAAYEERTVLKYKGRAERYVHIEVGNTAENVHLQAIALDLGTVVVGAFDDAEVKRVLSLASNEKPLCLMPIGRG